MRPRLSRFRTKIRDTAGIWLAVVAALTLPTFDGHAERLPFLIGYLCLAAVLDSPMLAGVSLGAMLGWLLADLPTIDVSEVERLCRSIVIQGTLVLGGLGMGYRAHCARIARRID